jgi:hypothetical protein
MTEYALERCWHASSSLNRDSIAEHGLDWRRMGATSGIAAHPESPVGGRYQPEAEAIFLSESLQDAEWFAGFGQHPLVDIWEADVAGLRIEDGPDGWLICRDPIPASRLRLIRQDVTGDAS